MKPSLPNTRMDRHRRGLASLELVMVVPLMMLLVVLLFWEATIALRAMDVDIQARFFAWSGRFRPWTPSDVYTRGQLSIDSRAGLSQVSNIVDAKLRRNSELPHGWNARSGLLKSSVASVPENGGRRVNSLLMSVGSSHHVFAGAWDYREMPMPKHKRLHLPDDIEAFLPPHEDLHLNVFGILLAFAPKELLDMLAAASTKWTAKNRDSQSARDTLQEVREAIAKTREELRTAQSTLDRLKQDPNAEPSEIEKAQKRVDELTREVENLKDAEKHLLEVIELNRAERESRREKDEK